MSYWLYQMDQTFWTPERYRLDIWENARWSWEVRKSASKTPPDPGDVVVFFYAPTGGKAPGFYGWAVIAEWESKYRQLYFTPVAPSNELKMRPWWDDRAKAIADKIRGRVKQGTFWPISQEQIGDIRRGISSWIYGAQED
jgi:hypothetical protein